MILAATSSMVRVIDPQWLRPGMHVGCIKSQEIDGEVLERCDRVFVHNRQQAKQINNVMPGTPNARKEPRKAGGRIRREATRTSATCCPARRPARRSEAEITCFANNVGTGLQFAAAGAAVLEKARQMRIGTELPDDWFSEDVIIP